MEKEEQQQKLVSMAEFECGKCHGKIIVRMPKMEVVNRLSFSEVIFSHERPSKCPSCGELYLPLLSGISEKLELKLVWKMMPQVGSDKSTLSDQVTKLERKTQ